MSFFTVREPFVDLTSTHIQEIRLRVNARVERDYTKTLHDSHCPSFSLGVTIGGLVKSELKWRDSNALVYLHKFALLLKNCKLLTLSEAVY